MAMLFGKRTWLAGSRVVARAGPRCTSLTRNRHAGRKTLTGAPGRVCRQAQTLISHSSTHDTVDIVTFGLNHRTAPVRIREQVAIPSEAQPAALLRLVHGYGFTEAAIISTCNRFELYLAGAHGCVNGLRSFLQETRGVDVDCLKPHSYILRGGEAAEHLFRVACGINSLVIGESQITSQVRCALEQAQRCDTAGILINELFQRALSVGKLARSRTDISRGRVSVSSAAVELAGRVFDRLTGCTALLIGAGETGVLTARYLLDACVSQLLVTNRTATRAGDLACRVGARAVPFEDIPHQLTTADIVISTTAAPGFVIDAAMLQQAARQRQGRPLFLIDIAVPRDIDPAARTIENVHLFDIDALDVVVAANRGERENEICKVETLIREELSNFISWHKTLSAAPLIRELMAHAERLRQTELQRWNTKLEQLSSAERELVESILRGYANKLLHQPLVQMRGFADTTDGQSCLDTVRRLFGLNGSGQAAATEQPQTADTRERD